jgi:hydrogenase maturation protease
MRMLIYGYGNPGRQDDGLGIELVNRLQDWADQKGLIDIRFEANYQLNIEDAELISHHELVIFADASEEEIEDFCLSEVEGRGELAFTTHSASPGYILKLCQELFLSEPQVFLLHIKGYEWEFKEGISDKAGKNLDEAFAFMKEVLEHPDTTLGSKDEWQLC